MPRILHHHVESSLFADDRRGGGIGGFLRQHVEFERMQLDVLRFGERPHFVGARLVASFDIAHRRVDDMAGFGQRLRGEFADARTRARNQNDVLTHFSSPIR